MPYPKSPAIISRTTHGYCRSSLMRQRALTIALWIFSIAATISVQSNAQTVTNGTTNLNEYHNTAVEPAPRTKAGWMQTHEQLCQRARQTNVPVLFIGDSITQYWLEADKGAPIWKERYQPLGYVNIGIGGDRTQNILWRLQNGGLGNMQPKVTVLLIGVNNIKDNTPDEIVAGIKSIVQELKNRLPKTKIQLLGIFPKGKSAENPARGIIAKINNSISQLNDGQSVFYIDIGSIFLQQDGSLKEGVMLDDRLHITTEGYRLWANAMQESLDRLLAK